MSNKADSPFGLVEFLPWNHRWNNFHTPLEKIEQSVALMKGTGAGWIRLEFILSDIFPPEEAPRFSEYDKIVDVLQKNGFSILGLLINSPTYSDSLWNQLPSQSSYLKSALEIVRRYGETIHDWEIWNEPDHELFWKPQDGMFRYSQLLTHAYAEIKAENSDHVVHLAGLSKSLPASLRQIYEHAGASFFDVVHIHPFVSPSLPRPMQAMKLFVDAVRRVMTTHGDVSKPIWFSEIACPGVLPHQGTPDWWLGRNPTEAQQAEWVQMVYGECLTWPGVKKVFWGQFRDTNNFFKSGVDRFGLIRNDFTLKPSYAAYQKCVSDYQKKGVPPAASENLRAT